MVIARLGGSIAAGVTAVFPAIFMTTMISLWLSQGEAVQVGAVGPMMLGLRQPAHVLTASVTARGIVNMTAVASVEAQMTEQAG